MCAEEKNYVMRVIGMNSITEQEIDILARYIFSISGIHLDRSKGYLLEARLKPLLAAHGLKNYNDLYRQAIDITDDSLKKDIIDAITTNETFFFRDNTPFDLLKNKIIPDLIDRRSSLYKTKIPIRIWSAACSTGQEVYSIAITLLEMLPNPERFDISILGTDISSQAVSRASYGKYDLFEIERGLPPAYRKKYFTATGREWRIKDEVRHLAQFKKINLLGQLAGLGKFDVVFCRNVAIYFDMPNKIKLFRKIAEILLPGGALIVGGSESLTGLNTNFEVQHYLRGNYYTVKGNQAVVEENEPAPHFPLPSFPHPPPPEGPLSFPGTRNHIPAAQEKTDQAAQTKASKLPAQPAPDIAPSTSIAVKPPPSKKQPHAGTAEKFIMTPAPASSPASLNGTLRQKTQSGKKPSLLEELAVKKHDAGLLVAAAGKDAGKEKKSLLESISQKQKERKRQEEATEEGESA